MREIKFKIWDTENKEMITFWQDLEDHFTVNGKGELLFQREGEEPLILLQFTGLKDKNGKEIYEGDIVKNNNQEIGKIIWKDFSWIIFGNDKIIRKFNEWIEVIGNIYENQELLK